MTAKKPFHLYLGTENFGANSTPFVVGAFPVRLADGFIDRAHRVDKLQLFVKVVFPGAAPTTMMLDMELQYDLAETDALEGNWKKLVAGAELTSISGEGIFKGDVYSGVMPRRIRAARQITASAYGGGVNLEMWLGATYH